MTHKKHAKPDELAISVKNLHKTFRIPLEGGNNLKQRIVNFSKRRKGYREFSPLNGVSFDIQKGEFFGIVGRNGSGKSTLLKTMAGIYTADKGSVKVNGSLVPFIELGVGFNPELTGRENVYLNGALLGFSREEMSTMYEDIVEFAELEEFMDERLKNYSSGMQVRLAFSIAIRAKGDILLLDEVLAVGDSAFQQKCVDYFKQLKEEGRTVILVTHSMTNIEKFCTRALLLDNGKVEIIGSSEEVAEGYRNLFKQHKTTVKTGGQVYSDNRTRLESVSIIQDGNVVDEVQAKKPFSVLVKLLQDSQAHTALNVGLSIRNKHDILMIATNTIPIAQHGFNIIKNSVAEIEFKINDNIYTNGEYYIDVNVKASVDGNEENRIRVIDKKHIHSFTVVGIESHDTSLTHPSIKISMRNTDIRDNSQKKKTQGSSGK